MKRTMRILAGLLLAVTMLMMGCTDEEPASGTMLLVIGEDQPVEYTVNLDEVEVTEGVLSILKYLHQTEGLEYSVSGGMLKRIGGLSENASTSVYLSFYTTVEKDFDVSYYATTLEYAGKTLNSAIVGMTDLTVKGDCIIYIGTFVYG